MCCVAGQRRGARSGMEDSMQSSVIGDEVARFGALADQWWDPSGPMAPLHAMNPLRIGWIDQRLKARFAAPVRLLDIGCGAGLAAEALARAGHDVTGVDAAAEAIAAAKAHALLHAPGARLAYRCGTAEALLAEGARFQAVTALEVIEHVADPQRFVADLAGLLAPGGLLFLSTLNRTPQSYAMAKIGAEYLLRLLPVGTHRYRQFIRPEELARMLREAGGLVTDTAGMRFNPFRGEWQESRDLSVNYIVAAMV